MTTSYRIPTPLGPRIDLDKVEARLDALLASLLEHARSARPEASKRVCEAALEIAYLARLKGEALGRNGLALQAAERAAAQDRVKGRPGPSALDTSAT
jgi:hypothetical protein